MAEWENNVGESDEWYTPQGLFDALGLRFDLDPCSPGSHHWVPAEKLYTKFDDGLHQEWEGLVFMNPPYGRRNGQVPWLQKFIQHGFGIAIVRAYTSAKWFQDMIPECDAVLFPRGKTKFIKPNGDVGGSPGSGIVILAMGDESVNALEKSDLGWFVKNPNPRGYE